MAQTASTGNLSNVQETIINAARFVQEHNAPSWQLIEKIPLPQGASTVRVPKVGQFVVSDLVDGLDMTDEQSIGLTYVDLTSTERGAKIIVTDKLVRQNGTTPIFSMIGRQFGDAAARKQDRDTQALYSALNGGTAFGAAASSMGLGAFAGAIARARGGGKSSTSASAETGFESFNPTYAIVHPHSAYDVVQSATAIGSGTSMKVNDQREERYLQSFFTGISFNGVDLYESGNINVDSSGDMTGVIAQRDALVGLTSVSWRTERQRDASARGFELNHVADYGVFELDDKKGAPLLYDAGVPGTSS